MHNICVYTSLSNFCLKNSCFPFFQLSSFLVVSKKNLLWCRGWEWWWRWYFFLLFERALPLTSWAERSKKIVSLLLLKVPTLETWVKAHLFFEMAWHIMHMNNIHRNSTLLLSPLIFSLFFCRCCSSFTHSHPHPLFHPSMPSNHNDDDDDDVVVVAVAAASVQKCFTYDIQCFFSLFSFFSKE